MHIPLAAVRWSQIQGLVVKGFPELFSRTAGLSIAEGPQYWEGRVPGVPDCLPSRGVSATAHLGRSSSHGATAKGTGTCGSASFRDWGAVGCDWKQVRNKGVAGSSGRSLFGEQEEAEVTEVLPVFSAASATSCSNVFALKGGCLTHL